MELDLDTVLCDESFVKLIKHVSKSSEKAVLAKFIRFVLVSENITKKIKNGVIDCMLRFIELEV